jgi:predicted regulator of Ras-like GTPase activity (Roadblock/LC7/MglB family)
MVISATSWTLTSEDELALRQAMERLLQDCGAHAALLVDRGGQLLTQAGERPAFDATTFATLTAADFSANDQLARLLGENDFTSLVHQGDRESMLDSAVARRAILIILFDARTTLGLIRLRLRPSLENLSRIVDTMMVRDRNATPRPAILAGADDEIDRLFQ